MAKQTPEQMRLEAEQAEQRAGKVFVSSETPHLSKGAYLDLAKALRHCADVAEETAQQIKDAEPPNEYERRRLWRIVRAKRRAAYTALEAARAWVRGREIGSSVPLGQPILVGHHSERGHRATLKRIDQADQKCFSLYREAKTLQHRAQAAENDDKIYDADPQVIAKLKARLAELEARRECIKAGNKRLKAGASRAEVVPTMGLRHWIEADLIGDGTKEGPITGWIGRSLSAKIKRVRDRIATLEARAETGPQGERRIGDVVIRENQEYQKVELHFPGKPAEDIRRILKQYGFRWVRSAGCWSRGINAETELRLQWLAEKLGRPITAA